MNVSVVTNPASDTELRNSIERLLADDADSPGQLESKLRQSFPRARVFYREGRWVNS